MAKALSIKVPTAKVIKSLEATLADLEQKNAQQEQQDKAYEEARQKWFKDIAKLCMAHFSKAKDIRTNQRWNGEVNVDFNIPAGEVTLPDEPKRPDTIIHSHIYSDSKENITNALNILKMSEELYVNASTMKSISKYL